MNKMKNNIAYIINSINSINSITGNMPVKKALQKTVYLLEHKEIDLGFNYILHFYGTYCAELDQETTKLSSEGILHFDYGRYGHKMSIDDNYDVSPESNLSSQNLNTIQELIERYKNKTPSDLELLTTAIYAYEHIKSKTQDEVIKNVKK